MAEGGTVEARVELTGECEGCGAPDGILGRYGDHFCPKCAGNVDLRDSAEQHLITYLTAALAPDELIDLLAGCTYLVG